mgnify:CR=1 FL=1
MKLKVKKRHAISELLDGTVGILCIRPPKNQKGAIMMDLKTSISYVKESLFMADEALGQADHLAVIAHLEAAQRTIELLIKKVKEEQRKAKEECS